MHLLHESTLGVDWLLREEEAVCVCGSGRVIVFWLLRTGMKIKEQVILKRSSLSASFGQVGRRNMKTAWRAVRWGGGWKMKASLGRRDKHMVLFQARGSEVSFSARGQRREAKKVVGTDQWAVGSDYGVLVLEWARTYCFHVRLELERSARGPDRRTWQPGATEESRLDYCTQFIGGQQKQRPEQKWAALHAKQCWILWFNRMLFTFFFVPLVYPKFLMMITRANMLGTPYLSGTGPGNQYVISCHPHKKWRLTFGPTL